MPNHGLTGDAELSCEDCGAPGAFAFDGVGLCADCYSVRGSSCAGGGSDDPAAKANATVPTQLEPGRHRLNPNCCYQACAQCSSTRRLRDFRAKFPQDWASRLVGSDRLIAVAQEGN